MQYLIMWGIMAYFGEISTLFDLILIWIFQEKVAGRFKIVMEN